MTTLKQIMTRDKFTFANDPDIWIAVWPHTTGGLVCENDRTGQRIRFFDGDLVVNVIAEITDEEIEIKKKRYAD